MIFGRQAIRKTTSALALLLILSGSLPVAFPGNLATNQLLNEKNSGMLNNSSLIQDPGLAKTSEGAGLPSVKLNSFGNVSTTGTAVSRFVVGLNEATPKGSSDLEEIVSKTCGKIVNLVSTKKEVKAMVVEIPNVTMSDFMEEVRKTKLASYIEPRGRVAAQFIPNDPYFNVQWGLDKIQADWAWNTTVGSLDVVVAIVDTGIDYYHPDLAANYAAIGYDWVNDDPDPMDDYGHGTHCAGIIAAQLNNSLGVAGVAQVRIMAEKVLDYQGEGFSDWIASGIIHAVDQGAKIISMSFGGYEDSEVMHDAIRYADQAGVLLVAAAGNDNTDVRFYPASYEEVIAVAATDSSDVKASFSNIGNWIELAAPGVGVLSTFPNNDYKTFSGTSMACPFVSGTAALIFSAYPNQTAHFVRFLLRYSADDLGQPGFDTHYGYGRINAKKSLGSPEKDHELVAFSLTTPPYLELGSLNTMTAEIFNLGKTDEHNLLIQLFANESVVWQYTLDSLPSFRPASINVEWTPIVEGAYNVTFYIIPPLGEGYLDNNLVAKFIYAGNPLKAAVLRSSDEMKEEILTNWNELNNQWRLFGTRMIYVDYISLNKMNITYQDLTSTDADVLIISNAENEEFKNPEIDAVERYVYEGHGLIITGKTINDDAPNNKRLAELVGLNADISLKWHYDKTDLLQISNTTHPLFNSVPNPTILPLVSTTVPRTAFLEESWDSRALAGGNYLARGYFNESAIVEFKGLLYFSPLLETMPPRYHCHLQLLYNAIMYSRYQKPRDDLAVSLDCPRYLMPTNKTLLNATVYNAGWQNESNIELYLSVDGVEVNTTAIPELPANFSRTISYVWGSTSEGKHNISAYALPLASESQTLNNAESRIVSVHFTRFVLWDNAHGTSVFQQTDYTYVNEMLRSEGFAVDELKSTRIDHELLISYDLLVLATSAREFSESEIADILEWVANGGSMLVIVNTGFDPTLRSFTLPYGVQIYRDAISQGLTRSIASHPITEAVHSIYYGSPELLEVRSPSQALAWAQRISDRFALVTATQNEEVVILSDSHIINNVGIGRADNEQLVMNIFHWLATGHHQEHDLAITLQVPLFVQKGDAAVLNATVRNRGSSDEINAEAHISINETVVDSVTISYLPSGGLYTFRYSWVAATNGDSNVTAYVSPVLGENFTINNLVTRNVPVLFYQLYRFPNKWVEEGGRTNWHTPDGCWSYYLPFDFPFYNRHYRTIYVSSNGLITFTGPDQTQDGSIRNLADKLAIAPAWHDWNIKEPYGIYVGQTDVAHVIVRWEVCDNSGTPANFAAKLGQDGIIQLFYGYSNQSISVIIGISNGQGHIIAEQIESVNHLRTRVFAPFEIDHELAVNIETPSFTTFGSSVILNATVSNSGLISEANVSVQLIINGSIVQSTFIPELNAGNSSKASWLWSPQEIGQYNVTAYAQPALGEAYVGDNVETQMVFVLADTTTYVSVDPQKTGVAPGADFTVNINITSVQNLYTWQVTLVFNTTVVKCLEAWLPSDNIFAYTLPLFPEPLIEKNYVIIGATLMGDTRPFTGCGTLCKVRFKAEAVGNTTLLLKANDTFLLDPQLRLISCELVSGFAESLVGDFNHNGKVDVLDLLIIIQAFGVYPEDDRWNPKFDLNRDSQIDMRDIAIIARVLIK